MGCPVHGVVVGAVPWARARSRFTVAFEEEGACLCAQMPWARAAVLLRATWRWLQQIVECGKRVHSFFAARPPLSSLPRMRFIAGGSRWKVALARTLIT